MKNAHAIGKKAMLRTMRNELIDILHTTDYSTYKIEIFYDEVNNITIVPKARCSLFLSILLFAASSTNACYYKAVLRAVEKEITNVTAADAFSPDATCTRSLIVTFLYRDIAD